MSVDTDIKRGIVLAGGGARGAYEAGVLAYIFAELPKDIIRPAMFNIFCGSSAGAIHASYLAGTSHIPGNDIDRLLDFWRDMRIEKMLRLGATDMLRLPLDIRALLNAKPNKRGILINSARLTDAVVRDLPWAQIRYNIRAGIVDALAVSATHVRSGKSTVFVDRHEGGLPTWSRDPKARAEAAQITSEHALASAAIPILFPAREINGSYYCDGGVRQNTPLSPALRLGASRVLVVGVSGDALPTMERTMLDDDVEEYPSPLFLIGKMIDSIMLDRLDYDLKRLEGFNRLLSDGRATFGEEFVEQINKTSNDMRGASYREIDTLVIRPSRDLGEMAAEFIDVFKSKLKGLSGILFDLISDEDALGESDLLSYLLFDGRLATAMIELGKADADTYREELIEFFLPPR